MNLNKQELKSAKVTIQSGKLVIDVVGEDMEKVKALIGFESETLQVVTSGYANGSSLNGLDGLKYYIVNVFNLAISS